MARAQNNQDNGGRQERNSLVVHEPRMPFPAEQANPLGITPSQWKTIVEAVWPSAKTVDGVVMALEYCRARNLDPFKRPVHIVPMWNSALGGEVETVWPGINDYRTTASRTNVWAGNDDCLFGPTLKRSFEDAAERGSGNKKYVVRAKCPELEFPEWAQVTVYKIVGGQRVPFVGPKVRFVEIFSGEKGLRVPNSRWQLAPWQMLEKCAEAAALRRAFPEELSGTYTAEEMEGKDFHRGPTVDATAVRHEEAKTGDVDQRPTRETVLEEWEKLGIPKKCWDDILYVQESIDKTTKVKPLRDAKADFVDRYASENWPDAALDELERRFDARILELDPPKNEELPLDGDAGATAADESGPAENEGKNEQTD